MVGWKTHEQFKRILERKPDLEEAPIQPRGERPPPVGAPETDYPESYRGRNQESEHNKHNRPPQGAHKH
jgi:hypothetical protein